MATKVKVEQEIRQVLDRLVAGVNEKNVDKIMGNYVPDVLVYDAIPPLAVRDAEGLRASWQMCFDHCAKDTIEYAIQELNITAGDDLAFATFIATFAVRGQKTIESTMRATSCLRLINGEWKVVHDHISVPFDPMTEKALTNLSL